MEKKQLPPSEITLINDLRKKDFIAIKQVVDLYFKPVASLLVDMKYDDHQINMVYLELLLNKLPGKLATIETLDSVQELIFSQAIKILTPYVNPKKLLIFKDTINNLLKLPHKMLNKFQDDIIDEIDIKMIDLVNRESKPTLKLMLNRYFKPTSIVLREMSELDEESLKNIYSELIENRLPGKFFEISTPNEMSQIIFEEMLKILPLYLDDKKLQEAEANLNILQEIFFSIQELPGNIRLVLQTEISDKYRKESLVSYIMVGITAATTVLTKLQMQKKTKAFDIFFFILSKNWELNNYGAVMPKMKIINPLKKEIEKH